MSNYKELLQICFKEKTSLPPDTAGLFWSVILEQNPSKLSLQFVSRWKATASQVSIHSGVLRAPPLSAARSDSTGQRRASRNRWIHEAFSRVSSHGTLSQDWRESVEDI
jgi:hypothetical protein